MQRFRRRLLFFHLAFLFFFLMAAVSYGQIPVNQQVVTDQIPSQVDPRTLTQSQLSALLNDKNRTDLGKDKNADAGIFKGRVNADTTLKNNYRIKKNESEKTFGEDVFSNASVTDLTELSTPPLDYPIGVGDHIIISLWGGAEFQENYVVAKDGAIFPKGLGKINVQALSFESMCSVVKAKFRSVVPSGTKISVSLGQPRSINVNVVGNVLNPGPITVSAFSNAFNVIAKAGGVTEYGNLRSIQIKRAGAVIDELDVYEYLTTGDFGKHIYLQNNDFIVVTFIEKKVLATGQFKRPMYYQLKKEEGIKALLNFSGGLKAEALSSTIKVTRLEDEKQIQRDFSVKEILKSSTLDYILDDGDIVKINLIKSGISNKVELQGEVKYPGVYELRPGEKLFDLINRAGGVTNNTYLQRAYVFRGAADSTSFYSDRVEINLTDIEKNDLSDSSNVTLGNYDIVQLFAKSEFNQQQYVEIFGEVRKPGRVKRYGGMSLQDLLFLTGGLNPSAEYGRLEISSILNRDSAQKGLNPTRTVVKSYEILSDLSIDSAASKVILMPYDQVFVRKNPTFELQQNIEVKGLVKYPGQYPRLNKFERLSSYIKRAGGLTDNADISGAVLLRRKQVDIREVEMKTSRIKLDSNGVIIKDSLPVELKYKDEPVSIDLGKALRHKNSKYDIILQENDIVFVPEINPFISVIGNVQSPLKITYDKRHKKLGYYIDKAGGFGIRPWRRRIFVTFANGKSKRTKNFAFFHFYPRVSDGSVITVPLRPQGQDVGDLVKSTIIAAIPVVLTAIVFKYIK